MGTTIILLYFFIFCAAAALIFISTEETKPFMQDMPTNMTKSERKQYLIKHAKLAESGNQLKLVVIEMMKDLPDDKES